MGFQSWRSKKNFCRSAWLEPALPKANQQNWQGWGSGGASMQKTEKKDANGNFTHNRADQKLCDEFNAGRCHMIDPRTKKCSLRFVSNHLIE